MVQIPLTSYLARIERALEVVADNVTVAEWIVEREEVKIADAAELRRQCDCLAACDGAVAYAKTALDRTARPASCSGGGSQPEVGIGHGDILFILPLTPNLHGQR